MHRESMIDLLVLDCFENMAGSSRGVWLLSVLREGFVGFANMNDAQLSDEIARRGLRAGDEEAGHDDWDDTNCVDEWPMLMTGTARTSEKCES